MKKGKVAIKTIATVVFLFILLVEELILSPLKKIKIVIAEKIIKKWSARQTIVIFSTCEVVKVWAKFHIATSSATGNTYGVYVGIATAIIFGFITLQIIIYGSDNLMCYPWYKKIHDFIAKYKNLAIKIVTESAIYIKAKEAIKKLKISIFRNQRGVISSAITLARRLMRKRKKGGKKISWVSPAYFLL